MIDEKSIYVICEKYRNGFSSGRIAKEFNTYKHKILKILRDNGVEIRNNSDCQRKFKIDEDFFNSIDTEEKAYWLGFISGDGNVGRNNNLLTISLSRLDKKHLIKFKNDIKSEHKILDISSFDKRRNKFDLKSIFAVSSLKIKNALINLNVSPDKSNFLNSYKYVPNDLLRHYWRGFIDADGCIQFKEGRRWVIGITGLKNICEEFSYFIKNSLKLKTIPSSHEDKRSKGLFELRFRGNVISGKVCELLYENSVVFLERKRELAKKAIENAKGRIIRRDKYEI